MNVQFLIGKFSETNYIYGIRTGPRAEWKYFKIEHSTVDNHPVRIQFLVEDNLSRLPSATVKPVDCKLKEEEKALYFQDDKLSFNGEELQSCKF